MTKPRVNITMLIAAATVAIGSIACGKPTVEPHPSTNWKWRPVTTVTTPASLARPLMAYDRSRHEVVLYGNLSMGVHPPATTWSWSGSDWTVGDTSGDFLANELVYDDRLSAVVALTLFTAAPETRKWMGSSWSAPVRGGPSPRGNESAAYDPISRTIIVFGGKDQSRYLGDTWSWDGDRWTELRPSVSPPARQLGILAFDPVLRKLVLFGGYGAGGFSSDTWTWDGSTWMPLPTSTRPPANFWAGTADPRTQAPLLVGSVPIASPSPEFGVAPRSRLEQWRWTGKDWVSRSMGAGPTSIPVASALDEARQQLIAVVQAKADGSLSTWIGS